MNASQRLEALVRHFNTTVKALSDLCGYERPQAFYDIQKGKTRNISPNVCDKITAAFPKVNRVWLLTGDGDMIIDECKKQRELDQDKAEGVMVPLVPLSAFAGPIKAYYEDGVDLRNCQRIYSPAPQADLAVQITGDSMEPTFSNGSVAFIKRINEAAFIPWGHPLVLDTENGVFIKIVMPDESDQAYIWAESSNPKYPKLHMPTYSILGMYRVLSVQKTFTTM